MKSHIINPYKRLFFGSLLLLFVCSSALITVLLQQNKLTDQPQNIAGEQASGRFKNHMGFSGKQVAEYNSLLETYHNHTVAYRDTLFKMQEELISELGKESVDTAKLYQISKDAARFQHLIRMETFHHLREIKLISSPEQQEALQYLYNNLLDESKARYGMQQGKGNELRSRPRHGRQMKKQ